jgi:hypothetical protein
MNMSSNSPPTAARYALDVIEFAYCDPVHAW